MSEIVIPPSLIKSAGKASAQYEMIKEGDRVMVALSGGKDSTTLLHTLKILQKKAKFDFEIVAVTIVYGMGEDYSLQHEHCKKHDIEHHIIDTEIFELSKNKMNENSSFCSFFSRMRRGALYKAAAEYKCNKLALGHHLDDAAESLFMNMMYNGTIRSLPPKYTADNGIVVIRPFCHVREKDLRQAALDNGFHTVGDEMCPGMQIEAKMPYARMQTKEMLKEMEEKNPKLFYSINAALSNIHMDSLYEKPEKKSIWQKITEVFKK